MQPLISNLVVKKFRKGEYIQREGQEPEGLMIIREGYAICASEKLSHKFVDERVRDNIRADKDLQDFWQKHHNTIHKLQSKRLHESVHPKRGVKSAQKIPKWQSRFVYQNQRVYFDDTSQVTGDTIKPPQRVPEQHIVYKDLVSHVFSGAGLTD